MPTPPPNQCLQRTPDRASRLMQAPVQPGTPEAIVRLRAFTEPASLAGKPWRYRMSI